MKVLLDDDRLLACWAGVSCGLPLWMGVLSATNAGLAAGVAMAPVCMFLGARAFVAGQEQACRPQKPRAAFWRDLAIGALAAMILGAVGLAWMKTKNSLAADEAEAFRRSYAKTAQSAQKAREAWLGGSSTEMAAARQELAGAKKELESIVSGIARKGWPMSLDAQVDPEKPLTKTKGLGSLGYQDPMIEYLKAVRIMESLAPTAAMVSKAAQVDKLDQFIPAVNEKIPAEKSAEETAVQTESSRPIGANRPMERPSRGEGPHVMRSGRLSEAPAR